MGSYINARLSGDSERDRETLRQRYGCEGDEDRWRSQNIEIKTQKGKQTRALHLHISLLAGATSTSLKLVLSSFF